MSSFPTNLLLNSLSFSHSALLNPFSKTSGTLKCAPNPSPDPWAFALPISSTRIVFSQLCPLIHIRSLLKCHRSVSLSLTILSNTLYPLFCILNALYTLDILYVWLISFIVCLPSNGRQAPQGQGFLSVLTPAKSLERRTMPDT